MILAALTSRSPRTTIGAHWQSTSTPKDMRWSVPSRKTGGRMKFWCAFLVPRIVTPFHECLWHIRSAQKRYKSGQSSIYWKLDVSLISLRIEGKNFFFWHIVCFSYTSCFCWCALEKWGPDKSRHAKLLWKVTDAYEIISKLLRDVIHPGTLLTFILLRLFDNLFSIQGSTKHFLTSYIGWLDENALCNFHTSVSFWVFFGETRASWYEVS